MSVRQVRATTDGITVTRGELPSGPGVRVRVTSAGICGSDLHMMGFGPIPVVVGHEFGGRLDDDSLVAVRPMVPCGQCPACRRGDHQLCPTVTTRLYGTNLDGGMADELLVDEGCLFPIPAGVDPTTVGLVEPIAVAIHAVNKITPSASTDDPVLVVGGGTIGLTCAAALLDRGFPVDVKARHPAQRTAALALGAGVDPAPGDYAVVVDAAGTTSSLAASCNALRPAGQLLVPSVVWGSVDFPIVALMKEVTITPAMMYGDHDGRSEFTAAADLLARRPEIADALVTHRFSLDDAAEAFATAANRSEGAIKVLLIP